MAIDIGGETQVLGLIGWPVAHSLSPAMHNAAAADLGLDLVYVPLPVQPDQLAPAVRGLAALGFRGANVTIPHKETIMPLLDEIDPPAAVIGAVNTLVVSGQWPVNSGGLPVDSEQWSVNSDQQSATSHQPPATSHQPPILSGHNTDWSGFLADLETHAIDVKDRDCLILGAGGSARAVAYGLATAGGRVHLFARRLEQARQIVTGLAVHCPPGSLAAYDWPALPETSKRFDVSLVVNTTPLGMSPHEDVSPWPDGLRFPRQAFMYDLVYNPAETKLMRQARAAGHGASNGLGMLLQQGALAFKLWTGLVPDLQVMAQALHSDPRSPVPDP